MALNELTKAQLIEKVREAQDREVEMRNERDAWKEQVRTTPAPEPVPEADALAGCIRSLDGLNAVGRKSQTNYGSYSTNPFADEIGRILRSLADRYHVNLVNTLPCDRAHLDQIDPGFVSEALRQAVMR